MQQYGMYRWHIMDPIRFDKELKITMQDLGWHKGGTYLAQKSDISSVCFSGTKPIPLQNSPHCPAGKDLKQIDQYKIGMTFGSSASNPGAFNLMSATAFLI
jgi:hypothetical protein